MKKSVRVNLSELEIHPLVLQMKQYKPNNFMNFSMKNFGQKTAIAVVKRKDQYFILDGGHRFHSALAAGNVETLDCVVYDIPDDEILNTRITCNQKNQSSYL